MAENMVEVIGAVKKFKDVVALNDVSINFEKGKIHGIIGRNGSGKTVLFKTICGFMKLDSGKIHIEGKEVKPTTNQEIGLIIEEPGFIDSLSGYKNLKLLASIRRKINDEDIKKAIELVGLDPTTKKPVKNYSLGMRHRLAIAQAIMEKPRLLILDEPMNGLDKSGVIEMRQLFKRLKEEGITIILSSHYAEDIEALCETVCEMDNGFLVKVQ
ncbi:ATP-binding cassette domain-containing protein [Aquibacillus koreensis]|uniref:ATP-binding cassette domain-containing protein n=1 Tax=Aquibacillus koreensis TaxID=279446 RepID=A0A9X3WQI5_9BACI|nr:ATP-binding cassette domain-containing protein [Aquibacillus koreensis]MCT2536725.1 ATP-binding cassette domain-containing protein [Aquibacillus koreensis]MDC3421519.1 ATP-binding cassette domain-containing protein [Aquibacillus koreensis]